MASTEKNPSDPLTDTGTTQMQGATQTQSGAEAQGEGEHLTERARRKAGELAGDLKRQAEGSAQQVRERARSAVDQQKEAAVGGIEGMAQALRSASDDLQERGQPVVAEYSRQVAAGLESMADWVSRRNLDDLVGGVEDFARQRPVAFIGGAVVAGFALARFMKSSSARRSRTSGYEYAGAAAGSYGQPRRPEYGGSSAGRGSYGQPRGTEYGGSSAGSGSPREDMSRPSPASAGTPPGSYGRPTEGGL
jgi:uncharacterized protein YjbJ (UPF0337 family)